MCARRASGMQKGSSTLCVRQVCARRAPGVRVSGVRQVTSVRQVCARRAFGCVPGVRQACSDILPTCPMMIFLKLGNCIKAKQSKVQKVDSVM